MEIKLKQLILKNFKGVKELDVSFGDVTNISGENGTGKTTIVDAFTWLLFGKDSKDKTSFDIKTINSAGEVIHGLEHEVRGVITVDDKEIELGKIYKEKWTKKRGEANKDLTGHETLHFINSNPASKGEYEKYISSIVEEKLFKLITNPLYFNTALEWKDRRKVLLDIIGDFKDTDVINYSKNLEPLLKLLGDTDIETLSKSIKARKAMLNNAIKAIPIRIDEANNSIKSLDFDALEFRRRGIKSGIKSIDEQLQSGNSVNEKLLEKQNEVYKLKSELQKLEYEIKENANKPLGVIKYNLKIKRDELEEKEYLKQLNSQKIKLKENEIKHIKESMDKFRKDFMEESKKELEISNEEFVCPTCRREYESGDIAKTKNKMIENFNSNKAQILKEIQVKGIRFKESLGETEKDLLDFNKNCETYSEEIVVLRKELEELENKKGNFKPSFSETAEIIEIKKKIEVIEKEIERPTDVNVQDLKNTKAKLTEELEEVNKELNSKETNKELEERIKELQGEERDLAQQIASLEKQEFLCEEFVKTKVELLEGGINKKFKNVTFKLFDTQVNGAIVPCCEALINGVPFMSANTASQVNGGLDIINTLCKHYNVAAPIFIDNKESVNKLIDTDSQIINLIVSKDKKLKIESEEM